MELDQTLNAKSSSTLCGLISLKWYKVGDVVEEVQVFYGQDNVVDLAICDLVGATAESKLHDYPRHSDRIVPAGVVEPQVGMKVTMLCANTNEKSATIVEVGKEVDIGGAVFKGKVELEAATVLLAKKDISRGSLETLLRNLEIPPSDFRRALR